jgi:hypothetical protein
LIAPCVIQITTRIRDNAIVPELSGQYLYHYDPRRDLEGGYYLSVVEDRSEAKVFASQDEAMKYYLQTCQTPSYYLTAEHINRPLAEDYRVEIVFLPMTNS